MRKRPQETNEELESFSPWEVYSDLYCGLLLVFVLLFFFAIYQYIAARETNDASTRQLQADMKEEQEAVLALYKADLDDQEKAYQEKNEALAARDAQLTTMQARLEEKESELEESSLTLQEQQEQLSLSEIKLREQEELLTKNQEELKTQADALAEKEGQLETQKGLLSEKESELKEQRGLLAERESELEEQRGLLSGKEAQLNEKDKELAALQTTIRDQETMLKEQQEALDNQTRQIEQIVGVRSELIEELRRKMSENNIQVEVDADTGAIAFESEILFELNSNELKEEGKAFFRTFVPAYLSVLLQPEFREYIAEIIIEGHTDSAGAYLHNLELSQQRAYSVAAFILNDAETVLDDAAREELKSMITVNGCADRSPVHDENGQVDADKSRRVEMKFSLMDREMVDEMNRILNMESTEDS